MSSSSHGATFSNASLAAFWNCVQVTILVQDTQTLASLPPHALCSSLSTPFLYPVLPLTFSFPPPFLIVLSLSAFPPALS